METAALAKFGDDFRYRKLFSCPYLTSTELAFSISDLASPICTHVSYELRTFQKKEGHSVERRAQRRVCSAPRHRWSDLRG